MISFNTAKAKIFEVVKELPARLVMLDDAHGLVLAKDIVAPIDIPPFDNSAMDGYALKVNRSAGLQVCRLQVSQIIKAGDAPNHLKEGTCAKIMTGAPIPEGADTVVPVEDITNFPSPLMPACRQGRGEGWGEGGTVIFNKPFKKGRHVRYKGEDVKKGELAARKGVVVNSRLVALLAALGLEKISAVPAPQITVLVTGSELQNTGTFLAHGKIFDSNSHALRAALKEIGINAGIFLLADDKEKIFSSIKRALENCDLLITIGGVSVGDYDYVKEAFKRSEVEEVFHKVAIRPGKPLYFGVAKGSKLVFGLPGNPVSCLITFDQFVRPAIHKMMGMGHRPQVKMAVAAENLKGSNGKRDFLRGICKEDGGLLYVISAGSQGSAMLKSLVTANCTIIIPEERETIEKGEHVEVELC